MFRRSRAPTAPPTRPPTRGATVFLCIAIGALLGVIAVLLGEWLDVPGFCGHTGFMGTEYLNSFLYAIGDPFLTIPIVAFVWAVYGCIIGWAVGELIASCESSSPDSR